MKVAFLGTGLMGEPMALRLLGADISVIAYNRTPSKLATLEAAGARVALTPEQALQDCDCAIAMLSDAPAIEATLLSDTAKAELRGRTILGMSTIAPTQSREIRDAIAIAGGEYLEAPVLGSIPEAKSGSLIVMVGATPAQFQQWESLLGHVGTPVRYIGEVGTATALKLALNQLIASLTAAFSLSMGLVEQRGVSIDLFMEILRASALYAPTFDKKLARMLERNYSNPNFPTKHLLKDTNLFLQEAATTSLNVEGLTAIRGMLETAIAKGYADADYAALFEAIADKMR